MKSHVMKQHSDVQLRFPCYVSTVENFSYQSTIVKHINTHGDTFNQGLFEFPVTNGDLLIVMRESKIQDF